MKKEEWVKIKGFEPRFQISNYGRLLSINGKHGSGNKILSPYIDSLGYYSSTLRMKPFKRKVRIHTLVAEHFISEKPYGIRMTVNHIDGNKLNNHVDNLEWVEASENCAHAIRIGLTNNKGEKHGMAKLTSDAVIEIRKLYFNHGYTHKKISEIYSVSRRQIGDIINRKNWAWLI